MKSKKKKKKKKSPQLLSVLSPFNFSFPYFPPSLFYFSHFFLIFLLPFFPFSSFLSSIFSIIFTFFPRPLFSQSVPKNFPVESLWGSTLPPSCYATARENYKLKEGSYEMETYVIHVISLCIF